MILIFALGSSEDQYSDLEWSDSLVIRQIQIQEYILENLVLNLSAKYYINTNWSAKTVN